MAKLLLMSVLFATIALPLWFARMKSPRAGAKKTIATFAVFTALWILFVAYFYSDMMGPIDPALLRGKGAAPG
jgi:hypothetical protein